MSSASERHFYVVDRVMDVVLDFMPQPNRRQTVLELRVVCKLWDQIVRQYTPLWKEIGRGSWPEMQRPTAAKVLHRLRTAKHTGLRAASTHAIEDCLTPDFFQCPLFAEEMQLVGVGAEGRAEYFCKHCKKHVYEVRSWQEFEHRQRDKQCVIFERSKDKQSRGPPLPPVVVLVAGNAAAPSTQFMAKLLQTMQQQQSHGDSSPYTIHSWALSQLMFTFSRFAFEPFTAKLITADATSGGHFVPALTLEHPPSMIIALSGDIEAVKWHGLATHPLTLKGQQVDANNVLSQLIDRFAKRLNIAGGIGYRPDRFFTMEPVMPLSNPGWTSPSWANEQLRLVHAPDSFASLDGVFPKPREVFSGEVTFKFDTLLPEDVRNVIMSSHGNGSGWELRADVKKGVMLGWTVKGIGHIGIDSSNGPPLSGGKWHHAAFCFEPRIPRLMLFVDGEKMAEPLEFKTLLQEFIPYGAGVVMTGRNPQWPDRAMHGWVGMPWAGAGLFDDGVTDLDDVAAFVKKLAAERLAAVGKL